MKTAREQPWQILLSAWKKRKVKISLYPVVSKVPEEIKKLSGREKAAALSRFARQSAAMSAQKSRVCIETFDKDASGMPVPSNGVFWSISHKPDVVAGVVAKARVGIDIEVFRPVSNALFDRIIHPEEERLFGNHNKKMVFFRVFTAKEAVLKHAGDGIKGLSGVTITNVMNEKNLCVRYLGQKYFIENFFGDGYLASVTKPSWDVQWTVA